MGEVSSQWRQTLPTIIGKDAPKIEPPHPSNPIMRRPGADLEEKHEPPGTLSGKAEPNAKEKRNEVRLLLTDAAIEKPPFRNREEFRTPTGVRKSPKNERAVCRR